MPPRESESPAADVLARARAAGLDRAAALFPDDVMAAAEAAARAQSACAGGVDPTDEPWPPMRAKVTP